MGKLQLTLVRSEPLALARRGLLAPGGALVRVAKPAALRYGRRSFAGLSTTALAAMLLPGVGAMTAGCEQAAALGEQLLAEILQYLVDKLLWALDEAIGGDLQLENHEAAEQTGNIDMELLAGETVADGASGDFSVPAGMVNTYKWSGLSSNKAGDFVARALSKINEQKTGQFSVK